MNKHTILTLFLFLASLSTQSQTVDSISGNWKFKDMYESEKMDTATVSNLRKMFSEMTLNLKPDHLYEASLFSKENGNWEYFVESQILELRTGKARNNQIKVKSFTNNQLVLEVTKNNAFVMEKIE